MYLPLEVLCKCVFHAKCWHMTAPCHAYHNIEPSVSPLSIDMHCFCQDTHQTGSHLSNVTQICCCSTSHLVCVFKMLLSTKDFILIYPNNGATRVHNCCIWWGMFGCTYHASPKDKHHITQTLWAGYKLSISDMNRHFVFIIHTKYIYTVKKISSYVFQIQCSHNCTDMMQDYIGIVWVID